MRAAAADVMMCKYWLLQFLVRHWHAAQSWSVALTIRCDFHSHHCMYQLQSYTTSGVLREVLQAELYERYRDQKVS